MTSAPEDDKLPAWSPDGRSIAFCRDFPDRTGIYVIPALGGAERKIAEAGQGVSWWPDSKSLALGGRATDSSGIFLLALATGEGRQLTTPAPYYDDRPAVSPDGRRIAFIRNFSTSAKEIFVVEARGGAAKQLTFDRRPVSVPAWTAGGREIVFSNSEGGASRLWRMPAAGGTPQQLHISTLSSKDPAISPRGDRLAYNQSLRDTNIYRYEAGAFNPEGLIMSSREDHSPSISPDGVRIAFVSRRTGDDEIWICDRKGGRPVQLTFFKGPSTGTPRWSPDGKWIAFDSRAGGSPDVYVAAADGGAPRRLTSEPSSEMMPSWSPDGKWIYFSSDRSGSDQIWKMPPAGGVATQVTRGGAWEGLPSADGKLVFFLKHDGDGIWFVPAEGGAERPVQGLETRLGISRSWGVLNEGIYYISKQEAPRRSVRFFSFATRRESVLALLDREILWNVPCLAVSRDARWLLAAQVDQELDDLMLVENFR